MSVKIEPATFNFPKTPKDVWDNFSYIQRFMLIKSHNIYDGVPFIIVDKTWDEISEMGNDKFNEDLQKALKIFIDFK